SLSLGGCTDNDPATPATLTCDATDGPCVWSLGANAMRLDVRTIPPRAPGQGPRWQLRVTGMAAPSWVILEGRTMFMGTFPVGLNQQDLQDGAFLIEAPLCTTDSRMQWQLR